MQSIGVALCDKYRLSKGKSFVAFLDEADDSEKFKLLSDLFEYYEEKFESEYTEDFDDNWLTYHPTFDERYRKLYLRCKDIMMRNSPMSTPLASVAEALMEKFSSEYLIKQITLMIEMQEKNPTEAIGKAKELIESCCKTILDILNVQWDKEWTVTNLAGATMERLKLMPANIPDTAAEATTMKALLGNLLQVATRMAELRNPYGSGHGKSATYKGLEPRHAKLAVGASITLVTFLWETHEKRSKS